MLPLTTLKEQQKVRKIAKTLGVSQHTAAKIAKKATLKHRRRSPGRADLSLVDELELYGVNDANAYERCLWPIIVGSTRATYNGRFNPAKACGAVRRRCVRVVVKDYQREFGSRIRPTTADRNVLGAKLCKKVISDTDDNVRNGIVV
jgi:hypothetical protein